MLCLLVTTGVLCLDRYTGNNSQNFHILGNTLKRIK